jgi:hypothetical protein
VKTTVVGNNTFQKETREQSHQSLYNEFSTKIRCDFCDIDYLNGKISRVAVSTENHEFLHGMMTKNPELLPLLNAFKWMAKAVGLERGSVADDHYRLPTNISHGRSQF